MARRLMRDIYPPGQRVRMNRTGLRERYRWLGGWEDMVVEGTVRAWSGSYIYVDWDETTPRTYIHRVTRSYEIDPIELDPATIRGGGCPRKQEVLHGA